jgi:large repetitive protein
MSVTLSILPIDANGFINAANVATGITITGTSSDTKAGALVGQTVTLKLDGTSYTGTIAADGSWSVTVPAANLTALTNGKVLSPTASVTDADGHKGTASTSVTVDETAKLTIAPIDGTGFVSAANAAGGITISGASRGGTGTGDFAGQTLTVTLNGENYTAIVAADGTWSVAVGASALGALTDGQTYNVAVSATDEAGNPASASASRAPAAPATATSPARPSP